MVTVPDASNPLSDEPRTLMSLEALARRSDRLTSKALARRDGKIDREALRRIEPHRCRSPIPRHLRAVWKESFCSCSVSPCSARFACPPLSRSPASGKREPCTSQRYRAGTRDGLADRERQIRPQGARDAAHAGAQRRRERRDIEGRPFSATVAFSGGGSSCL